MHGRTIKIGTGILATVATTFALFPSAAYADYAPAPKDVVGVGSDTLQALGNFVADGSYVADPGYNGAGNKYKFISIDATADANTRLAYGPGGANGLDTSTTEGCGPGTGSGIGTGNSGTSDTNTAHLPCVLNPTVVLRAGLSPEQRPNGSGAGYKLLYADTNTSTGAAIGDSGWGLVNFSRASAAKNSGNANFDSITVGTDTLAMLEATTTNAVALSKAQLAAIYQCTDTTWNQVGGSSTDTIYAMLPQVGSGTRTVFLGDIGVTTPGSCVHNVEENDPEAIADSGVPADAIEPMSGSRLRLFEGLDGTSPTGVSINSTGYFNDPSCPFNPTESSLGQNSGSNSPAACQGSAAALNPAVKLVTSGSTSDGGTAYFDKRSLYLYFRDADIYSPTVWQPGGSLNWVRTMFYDPCTSSMTSKTVIAPGTAAFTAAGCSIDSAGNAVGPGGDPYFASSAGQQDIDDSGVTPTWAFTPAAP